jgi:hypothetical protein
VVERGPEKAGVGGSIPSLATIFFIQILDVFRAALWVLRAHSSIACGPLQRRASAVQSRPWPPRNQLLTVNSNPH